jgi:hypothetical protein
MTDKMITPEMVLDVTNKAATGWSYRQIANWLLTTHNIKYSHVSVARCVNQHIGKRRKLSEEILKPYLEKSLTSDLDLLDDLVKEAKRVMKFAKQTNEPRLVLSAIDRLTKLADMRLKMSGAQRDDTTIETVEVDWQQMNDKYSIRPKKNVATIEAVAELTEGDDTK